LQSFIDDTIRFSLHRAGRLTAIALTGIALVVGSWLSGAAQSSGPANTGQAASAAVLQSQTNLVLVDVVVTEKNQAAMGLEKDRFQIQEDGKDRPLVSFEEHRPAAANARLKPAPLPLHVYSNASLYPAGSAVNVLLLDGLNTPVQDQMRTRQQMVDYMGKIAPGTPLAIFTLASRLRLVQGFTADPASLVTALKSGKTTPGQSVIPENDADSSSMSDSMSDVGASAGAVASVQQFEADLAAFQTDMRVRMTMEAMQQLARYLHGIPGRKNLIWFSGSFPISLDPDSSLNNAFSASRDYAAQLHETDLLLAASRVAVYPVDARGLMNLPAYSASYKGPSGSATRSATGGSVARDNQKFTNQMMAEHSSMQDLAEQTGGHAFLNTNDFQGAVSQAIEDGSTYYTLAYAPAAKATDGKFHKIKVHVSGGSYQLAYRRGYFATAEQTTQGPDQGSGLMQTAILRGAPASSEIVFQARLLPATDPAFQQDAKVVSAQGGEMSAALHANKKRYVVDLRVDLSTLVFDVGGDGAREAKLQLAVVGYDEDGKRLNGLAQAFALHMPQDRFQQFSSAGLPLRTYIDLPPGPVFLRLALREVGAEKIGSLEVPLRVEGK
jgi:VWFA-related protein